jgi:hypothetical protein
MSEPFDDEWRDLGFYCHHNSVGREYRLVGPRAGLLRFAELLRAYVADPRNAQPSEHEHYGPWGLEVMTWHEPGMDDHAIHGPLPKLSELADLVERHLANALPGQQVRIREEFTPAAKFTLVLDVRHDEFDPPTSAIEFVGGSAG